MIRILSCALACALLAGCGPKLEGERIAGRTVTVTNREEQPLALLRIVANDADGRAECVETPATTLPPGRTYSTTFFLCDELRAIAVETDRGTRTISFD